MQLLSNGLDRKRLLCECRLYDRPAGIADLLSSMANMQCRPTAEVDLTHTSSGLQVEATHVALLRPAAADGVAVTGRPSRPRMPGIFKTAVRYMSVIMALQHAQAKTQQLMSRHRMW